MGPDVLVRRGGSVAVARAVHRKMRLSPNTSATTSFRAERRIISKDHYTILCNVVLMNNFVLFLWKFGLESPEKFSAAFVSISSLIPSLRALWEEGALGWSEMREGNCPSDASGSTWPHVWHVWSNRGWGGPYPDPPSHHPAALG